MLKFYEREFPLLFLPFCFVWHNKVKSYLYYYYNFQLCDLEILVTAPEKCEVRGPKPQLLVFIHFTLIFHSELKINLDVHPSLILSLFSGLIDIVVSTSLFL